MPYQRHKTLKDFQVQASGVEDRILSIFLRCVVHADWQPLHHRCRLSIPGNREVPQELTNKFIHTRVYPPPPTRMQSIADIIFEIPTADLLPLSCASHPITGLLRAPYSCCSFITMSLCRFTWILRKVQVLNLNCSSNKTND